MYACMYFVSGSPTLLTSPTRFVSGSPTRMYVSVYVSFIALLQLPTLLMPILPTLLMPILPTLPTLLMPTLLMPILPTLLMPILPHLLMPILPTLLVRQVDVQWPRRHQIFDFSSFAY